MWEVGAEADNLPRVFPVGNVISQKQTRERIHQAPTQTRWVPDGTQSGRAQNPTTERGDSSPGAAVDARRPLLTRCPPPPPAPLSQAADGARQGRRLPALPTLPESTFSPGGTHRALEKGTRVFMPGGNSPRRSQRCRPTSPKAWLAFPKVLSVSRLLALAVFL